MSRSNLLTRSVAVRDETQPEGNSAPKVGQLLYDLAAQALYGFDPLSPYALGEYAFYGGILYRALDNVPAGRTPDQFPALWADDIARDVTQLQEEAPDRLVSQRAVVRYVADQLASISGGLASVPDATETKPGIVRRSSRLNATATNTTDYVSPALVLQLLNSFLQQITLQQVTNAGASTSIELLANGGISAVAWDTVDTAEQVFVARVVDGLLRLALIDKGKLGLGTTPDGTVPVWAAGDLYEQVARSVDQLLVWAAGDLYEQVAQSTPTAPAAPSNVRAIRTAGTLNAVLSWVDNADNETGFVIEQSANGSTGWTFLYETGPNITVLPLTGLALSTNYYYAVTAKNGVGSSARVVSPRLRLVDFSVTFGLYSADGTTLVRQLLPGGTSITPGMGNIGALITLPGGGAPTADDFDAVSLAAIDPVGNPQGWDYPDDVAKAAPYFVFHRPNGSTILPGTYGHVVKIYQYGQAIQTVLFATSFSAAPTPPATPSNFTATRTTGGVAFGWTDNANNENTFEIWIKQPGASAYTYLTTAQANATSATSLLSPLADDTLFQLKAVNSAGSSAWVTATLLPLPPTPTGLQTYSTEGGNLLIWNLANPGFWSGGSVIERATGPGAFSVLATINSGNTYADYTAVVGIAYSYRVKTINVTSGQSSSYSNTITATRSA